MKVEYAGRFVGDINNHPPRYDIDAVLQVFSVLYEAEWLLVVGVGS